MKKSLFTLLLITLASNAMDDRVNQEPKETKTKKGKVFLTCIIPLYAGFPDKSSKERSLTLELQAGLGCQIQPNEPLFYINTYDEKDEELYIWSSPEEYPHSEKGFLTHLPWHLIKDIKENEEFTFQFYGMAITLKAQQKGPRYCIDTIFEERLNDLLKGFEQKPHYQTCQKARLIEKGILQKTNAGVTHGPKGFDFSQLTKNNN